MQLAPTKIHCQCYWTSQSKSTQQMQSSAMELLPTLVGGGSGWSPSQWSKFSVKPYGGLLKWTVHSDPRWKEAWEAWRALLCKSAYMRHRHEFEKVDATAYNVWVKTASCSIQQLGKHSNMNECCTIEQLCFSFDDCMPQSSSASSLCQVRNYQINKW